jgi:hypothetical protein
MFRSSTYREKTFGNKINLSNTTNAESVDENKLLRYYISKLIK